MKKRLLMLSLTGVLAVVASQLMANEDCMMCHEEQEVKVTGHSDCMACHSAGIEAHLDNFRVMPQAVSDATCTTCHEPTEAFMALRPHKMGGECSDCHSIHED